MLRYIVTLCVLTFIQQSEANLPKLSAGQCKLLSRLNTSSWTEDAYLQDQILAYNIIIYLCIAGGHRNRDRMVVGYTTTYAISAYHH